MPRSTAKKAGRDDRKKAPPKPAAKAAAKAPAKSAPKSKPAKKAAPAKPSVKSAVSRVVKAVAKSVAKTVGKAKPAPARGQAVKPPAATSKAPPAKAPSAKAAVAKAPPTAAPAKPVAPKKPSKPEPPPIDHAATLGPLYLGAGHGHLARSVDKSWSDALARYRKALDEAVSYESKRSAAARVAMALNFGRQLQTLMNNLATRVNAIVAELHTDVVAQQAKDTARTGGRALVAELQALNETFGRMVGPSGIARQRDDDEPAAALLQQLDQLQRGYFNNIARFADLDRALGS